MNGKRAALSKRGCASWSSSGDRRAQGRREGYSACGIIVDRDAVRRCDLPQQFGLSQARRWRARAGGATAAILVSTRRLLDGCVFGGSRVMVHRHPRHHGHGGCGHGMGRRPHRPRSAQDQAQRNYKPANDALSRVKHRASLMRGVQMEKAQSFIRRRLNGQCALARNFFPRAAKPLAGVGEIY